MKALAMPVQILVVCGGLAGLGYLIGLGPAIVLAAICGMFAMMAAFGGSLSADLRLLAWFAPLFVFGAGVPRLLGEVTEPAAIALVTVIVFVAGLIPVLGQRYLMVGVGLTMASVFGYGFRMTGSASWWQVLAAPALAIAVVTLIRLAAGIGDPDKPIRAAIADALLGDREAAGTAWRQWFTGRPVRWTATALGQAMRYRAAEGVLGGRQAVLDDERLAAEVRSADEEARELAELVRPKQPAGPGTGPRRVIPDGLPGRTGQWLAVMHESLDGIRAATLGRDRSRIELPRELRARVLGGELEGALSWQSVRMRHAVRCALGIALALVLAHFRPGDPLTIALLMTTVSIMQPEWRDSLTKVGQRVIGALIGAAVLVLASWLLPPALLLPLALLAVLIGMSMMTTKPIVFNACVVLMSVTMNASRLRADPLAELLEYLILIALACAIGLVFGFLAVPGVRKPSPAERFAELCAAFEELFGTVAGVLRGAGVPRQEQAVRFRRAALAKANLLATEPSGGASAESGATELEEADEAASGLYVGALALALPGQRDEALAAALTPMRAALASGTEPDVEALRDGARDLEEEHRLVFDALVSDLVRLRRGAPETVGGTH
ncbi:FUSC family protein [Sciscionella marina]|uniref:FUSC family protein n=1 Tax=Sciscionella marina TaxID=508770 RepID=UPI0003A05224|nr:FUSC family protein [Sciscionella marina]